MIIKPKIRGFICTTTHPVGCEANVQEQIALTKAKGKIANGPKKVLVVGSSSGFIPHFIVQSLYSKQFKHGIKVSNL